MEQPELVPEPFEPPPPEVSKSAGMATGVSISSRMGAAMVKKASIVEDDDAVMGTGARLQNNKNAMRS
ncbi:hypothetical protein SCP_0705400 [Sparassis crispa]|uniref:Uncharacterized protein n=1 Tax=Sparassis crispa TaxID=139825 RepID=A0A401GT40_9APHY|nr:hypothetical protein SCP_0705400 [Sparassis crispa]GBE85353.1 hypothetical protein SCP_0705400 [Sparassis crispa]